MGQKEHLYKDDKIIVFGHHRLGGRVGSFGCPTFVMSATVRMCVSSSKQQMTICPKRACDIIVAKHHFSRGMLWSANCPELIYGLLYAMSLAVY